MAVATRAAALQAALQNIGHDVTVEHTGDVVEEVGEDMRRQAAAAQVVMLLSPALASQAN